MFALAIARSCVCFRVSIQRRMFSINFVSVRRRKRRYIGKMACIPVSRRLEIMKLRFSCSLRFLDCLMCEQSNKTRSFFLRRTFPFAVLSVVLFLPFAANASCGDYVEFAGQKTSDMMHAGGDHTSIGQPIPCSGPNCSRQRTQVPSKPVSISIPVSKKKCTNPPGTVSLPEPDDGDPDTISDISDTIHRNTPPVPPPR